MSRACIDPVAAGARRLNAGHSPLAPTQLHAGSRLLSKLTGWRQRQGFSLIELMVVVAVAAILLGVAVPAFNTLVQNNRLTADTNDFVASLQLARSEAAKRNRRVIVCNSTNAAVTVPACNGLANTWDSGWIVFADLDGNLSFDSGTDFLIQRNQSISAGLTVRSNATASTHVRFRPDGGIETAGTSAEFRVCDARGTASARQLRINPVGRPDVTVGTAACP